MPVTIEVRGAGEFDGSRGPADLVVDDGETVALARKAKHGEEKIVAVGAVDPAGAEDEEFAAAAFDSPLARELAGAVDIERIRRVRLDPRRGFAAVENVVGGVVDEKGVAPAGFFGEDARRLLVDGVGKIALGLGAVDGGVGGGVENDIGRGAANQLTGLFGIGEIDGFALRHRRWGRNRKIFFRARGRVGRRCRRSGCGDSTGLAIAHAGELRGSWKCSSGILNGCIRAEVSFKESLPRWLKLVSIFGLYGTFRLLVPGTSAPCVSAGSTGRKWLGPALRLFRSKRDFTLHPTDEDLSRGPRPWAILDRSSGAEGEVGSLGIGIPRTI